MIQQRLSAAVAALAVLSLGAVPVRAGPGNNPVVSDDRSNTAIGTGALNGNLNRDTGYQNTAAGYLALADNGAGYKNTAFGFLALNANGVGNFNSAFGSGSLVSNTSGNNNTALGADALYANFSGSQNTALGLQALYSNFNGNNNVALGDHALFSNKTGSYNTAVGSTALYSSSATSENTAVGYYALHYNLSGGSNTAVGFSALWGNMYGSYNSAFGTEALSGGEMTQSNAAFGYSALSETTGGSDNTAFGANALLYNQASNNIGIGESAGININTSSNNIAIGNPGVTGDSGAIRIGSSAQQAAYVQGIYGVSLPSGGGAVVISSTGQLGMVVSSERFKTGITSLTDTTPLEDLRPVTFHLKSDRHGPLQYGLIAEQVAKVYPDLVVRDEHGRINGVRYDELAPLLLHQVEVERRDIETLEARVAQVIALRQRLTAMRSAVARIGSEQGSSTGQ